MEIKKCLACAGTLIKSKQFFCKNKCQREYDAYRKGKKKFDEMFKDLRKEGRKKGFRKIKNT